MVVANTNSAISTGSGIALTLSVLRVVKGSSFAPGASVPAVWAGSAVPPAGSRLTAGAGIWFLKEAAGAWQVVPAVMGIVPLTLVYIHASRDLPALFGYGLDSLGVLELRTRIETETGIRISSTDITTITIRGLAELLCEKLAPAEAA